MGDRRVGVAVDFSNGSKKALKWTIDNILRKGHNLVLISVQPSANYESGEMQLWETTGSPLIPHAKFLDPAIMKKYNVELDAETLKLVEIASKGKEVIPLLKLFRGDPREKLCESVDAIPLSCLVIGNRGLGTLKRAILGSVSNFVLNNVLAPLLLCTKSLS